MSETPEQTTLAFQAEVKQLLHLMIHSLYSNKEIFLRELVSNASDACDKRRFAAIADERLAPGEPGYRILVETDAEARTVTIHDNGIGMDRDELVSNLGTIARSGTAEFLASLSGDAKKDAVLIGQFGVGFYASFVVADRVTVVTRRAGRDEAWRWESTGEGEFTVAPADRDAAGTSVTLHLRDGEDEFLEPMRLRTIVKKYSDHIGVPICLRGDDGEPETINRASALWTRPRNEIDDDEYREFYKHVSHDFADPLAWTHNHVEGRHEYVSLLYIPSRAPFDLWDRDATRGVRLFVRRVFILEDAEQLMPRYLRFVRGVIDSADLPLNVSREMLQNNRVVDSIRSGSTRKVLGLLDDLAKNDAEKFATFWREFGRVLKEGPSEDPDNRDRIAALLRFASTAGGDDASQDVSLAQYCERMVDGQDKIYYITADSHASAAGSPHLEVFRDKGIEVLLMSDRVDEWLVAHLPEFDGKSLVSVTRGELDLGAIGTGDDDSDTKIDADGDRDFIARVQSVLRDAVEDVRLSKRLTRSPSCIVASEHGLGSNLERLLAEAGQSVEKTLPVLELNGNHPMVARLRRETDGTRFADWSRLLLDQAILAEGGHLDNPADFVRRVNDVILSVAGDR